MTQSFDEWNKETDSLCPRRAYEAGAASRQTEIDKLEMEIKETQAFLNNQNHIKQAKIDELQKRINFLEVELKTSNDAIALKSTYKVTLEKGNKDD